MRTKVPMTTSLTKIHHVQRSRIIVGIVAFSVVLSDQITKQLVQETMHIGQKIPLVGNFISFLYVRNSGAAFSFGTHLTPLLSVMSLIATIVFFALIRRIRESLSAVILGAVLGGTLGNLLDRFFRGTELLHGTVIDFISVGAWPVFNVADSSISIGVFLYLTQHFLGKSKKTRKHT